MAHTSPPAAKSISPLRQLRLSSGVSATDFCRIVGCDISHLYAIESGSRRPSGQLKDALKRLGVDPAPILAAHQEWRAEQSARLSVALGDQMRNAAQLMGA